MKHNTAPKAGHNKQVVRTNYHETICVPAHTLQMGAKILLIYYTRGYFPKD